MLRLERLEITIPEVTCHYETRIIIWCREGESNPHGVAPAGF